ncbi:MBL fold metallo-hydrolase [Streptomyces sp. NPDC017993]|uniref:MBL fold metallo-hydrolase n=1 Tax=Streptomyces sp. NPDC017993 TaxID=3365027 RepID=UPI0037AC9DCC
METSVDEIADGIYRISTFIPEVAAPAGFTFNQFLVDAEEPLLFHTGMRTLFPLVSEAVGRVVPLEELRWVTFGHVEADECGAMNQFLAAAPQAEVAHGLLGCLVSLNDLADRPPRALAHEETLDLGGKQLRRRRVRHLNTPHVPHNWEARVLYEETTGTLLCGDLFTHVGNGPAVTENDLVEASLDAEGMFRQISCLTAAAETMRSLAELAPRTLAVMHGSSFHGDGAAALNALADGLEARFRPERTFAGQPSVLAGGDTAPS